MTAPPLSVGGPSPSAYLRSRAHERQEASVCNGLDAFVSSGERKGVVPKHPTFRTAKGPQRRGGDTRQISQKLYHGANDLSQDTTISSAMRCLSKIRSCPHNSIFSQNNQPFPRMGDRPSISSSPVLSRRVLLCQSVK